MMIMLYRTKAINNLKEKKWKINKNKNGSMQVAISQLIRDIQFFFVEKTLMRENASEYNCLNVGFINSPLSSFQPYEGCWSTSSINGMLTMYGKIACLN